MTGTEGTGGEIWALRERVVIRGLKHREPDEADRIMRLGRVGKPLESDRTSGTDKRASYLLSLGLTERTDPFPYAVMVFRDPDNLVSDASFRSQ